tara:strand:+ start:234 stop:1421 length:1188 start_codon:yes stop_codon:yes gene_type:complete
METTDDLDCMNCHRHFDRSTQRKIFTKVFIDKTYKKRREELLFQRECALLPATQPAITIERRKREIQKEIDHWRGEHTKKINEMSRITRRINYLSDLLYSNRVMEDGEIEDMKSAASFVMRCAHDNCKGFLSRAYKCGTCSEYTCPECHEPKFGRYDPNHVCDENQKKSVLAIQRECKPCVSCGTNIFKTEGCPQMFCTQCNILFDWNTGRRISHSSGHNPHFIQWLRNNGRNTRDVGDVLCGGIPDLVYIIRMMNEQPNSQPAVLISNIVRTILHIHHHERPRYPIIWNNDLASEYLRVRWSLGDITESEFKISRQRMEKKNLLKKEIGLVFEMVVNSSTDILQRFVNGVDNMKNLDLFTEFENLRQLTNLNMSCISKDFSNKTPIISTNWDLI